MRHWGVQSVQEAAQDEVPKHAGQLAVFVAVAIAVLRGRSLCCCLLACLLAGLGTDWHCYVPILIIPVLCEW